MLSYSVIMSRKAVLWVKSIQSSTRITSLENRAVHDHLTAPFVNLTEVVHLNCRVFFASFVYYHYIFDRSTIGNEHLIWEPIITSGSYKTAYDVISDSLLNVIY